MSDYKEQCWKRYMENKKYERYEKEDLIDEIIEMQGEIERLNNIIKEAIEYITNNLCDNKAKVKENISGKDIDGLLEILGSDKIE